MANELRFVDGALLFVDGELAMSADCCCEDTVTFTCNGNTFIFPSSVVLDLTGMAVENEACPGVPVDCDGLSGEHEVPSVSVGAGFGTAIARYELSVFGVNIVVVIQVPCLAIFGNGIISVTVAKAGPTCGVSYNDNTLPWRLDWTGQTFSIPRNGADPGTPCETTPASAGVET